MTMQLETKNKVKQFAVLSFAFLLILTLFVELPSLMESSAIGGGIGIVANQATVVTANSTTNTRAVLVQYDTKGTFIAVFATPYNPSVTISSITDTASDSYSKIICSSKYETACIYVANYTGTNNAANTITVTFSGSTSSEIGYFLISGVTSTNYQWSENNGTGTGSNVLSFTPNNNAGCISFLSVLSNSATAVGGTTPSFWDALAQTELGALFYHAVTQTSYPNWQSYGATTDSVTLTGTSGTPQWDEVAACFQGSGGTSTTTTTLSTATTTTTTTSPTTTTTTTTNGMSAGIVQEKTSTGITGTSNTATFGYKPQKYNLLLDATYEASADNANTPTDTANLNWTDLCGNTGSGLRIFAANYTVTSANETVTQTIATSHTFLFRLFELTGISSNYAIVNSCTNGVGTSVTASVTSFTPPTNWFGLETLGYFVGDTSSHTWNTSRFTQFNLDLSSMEGELSTTNDQTVAAYYPQWNMGSTSASMTPNSHTGSPAWNELVLFLPTQTNGIVTNTLTSTTTTTNTSSITTTTTTTSSLNTTTTFTSTNVTTITGTVIPEPVGSTDLLLLLVGIAFGFILVAVGIKYRQVLITMAGSIVLLVTEIGLLQANQLVYGGNIFPEPVWFVEVLGVVVVMAFTIWIFQLLKNRL